MNLRVVREREARSESAVRAAAAVLVAVGAPSLSGVAYRARTAYFCARERAPRDHQVVNDLALPLLVVAVGVLGIVAGIGLIRASGANTGAGRRLAGARGIALRDLHDLAERDDLPRTPVRIEGRVRCADPIVTPAGERLALLHRDLELQSPDGRWRTIERVRDARVIDLWQRSASVTLDLAQVAEPLVAIPLVWEGDPTELSPAVQPAVERVGAEHGPAQLARATTRQVLLVDELIVLAMPARAADGKLRLQPPRGGYLVTNADLDVAMRLLAGPHRRRMMAGYALAFAALVLTAAGLVATVVALIA